MRDVIDGAQIMSDAVVGAQAKDFSTLLDTGEKFVLSAHRGKPLVIYFYADDNTEGCTLQNREFSALVPQFAALGATVLGVSPDDAAKHRKFRAKHGLKILLAADTEHAAIDALGVWQRKKLYGREYDGVVRTSFIIAPDGTIVASIRATRIKGHAEKVLQTLRRLSTDW